MNSDQQKAVLADRVLSRLERNQDLDEQDLEHIEEVLAWLETINPQGKDWLVLDGIGDRLRAGEPMDNMERFMLMSAVTSYWIENSRP